MIFDERDAAKCELAAEVLRSSGALRLQVTGRSMLPTIWPGDTLIIERIQRAAVSDGEIVLFGRDRRLFVHRLISRRSTPATAGILTRGDAMSSPDPPLRESDLLGKVSFILRKDKRIRPRKSLRLPQRAVAAMIQRSDLVARIVLRLHGMFQTPQVESPTQTLRIKTT